jgi:hypothetical protein
MTGHRSPPPVGLEASDVPEADLEVSLAGLRARRMRAFLTA